VKRIVDFGVYLDDGDDGILLPQRYAPSGVDVDDVLDVFIYRDSEDRLIATTETPLAQLGDFACLEVVDTTSLGAFVNYGLSKDLIVPFKEQEGPLAVGDMCVLRVCLDETTDRLYGSTRLHLFLEKTAEFFDAGDEVDLIIADRNELGYIAIVDQKYLGLIHYNDVFTDLQRGQKLPGFVKQLRGDGKIDLVLQPAGYGRVAGVEKAVLDAIEAGDGFLSLTSKSSPDAIYDRFGVSKKAFKMAVSGLYKKRLISLEDDGIRLATTG
jgi:predicted RNA-binding protein (virulence factor B family)